MGLIKNVLSIIVIVVVLYLVYQYFFTKKTHLSGLKSGTKSVTINASKLSGNKSSNNYAYSLWFNIKDWKYRLNDKKILLDRSSKNSDNEFNPLVTLAAYENDININISTYPLSNNKYHNHNDIKTNHECKIRNVPLQKWVNLIISLNDRTLDVYLDGKLVRTCILPGVPKINPYADVHITPNGGFSGWTSNFQYWSQPLNPQEAYNVYKNGYNSLGLSSFLEKYKIKISYLVDNNETGSLEF